MVRMLYWFTAILLLWTATGTVRGGNVTYDGRSLIINGQHKILFSGSIHYPRSTPDMWSSLISKAKAGGIDVIQTYVFWNLHEPQQGQYHMKRFVSRIVNMMKSEKLYASQGGPIILSQVENEYKNVEAAFHEKGPSYVRWAALMAVNLQTGVPWVMCKQDDAPDPVINSCNGMRCGETFAGPNSPNKPSIWTENWTSFYQVYGEETYMRSAQDIAFHVALFIAKTGSYVNYYMYHGGTNFGRTASAFTITSYYDQAPLDEYGLIRQPKWGHLKELHAAIKSCSKLLLHGAHKTLSLGPLQQAYVFQGNSGQCAAFLVNNDGKQEVEVLFQSNSYKLPEKSISILPDCKTMTFNTAKVNAQYTSRSMKPNQKFNSVGKWEEYSEPIPEFDKTSLRANRLLEHMSTTKDTSDYLWYTFRFQQNLPNAQPVFNAQSHGHVLHAYVNGVHAGFGHGSHQNTSFSLQATVHLKNGTNNVALLSATVGLPDSGAYLERRVAGLRRVRIQNKDFTTYTWGYQVGLLGERLQIYTENGSNKVKWNKLGTNRPLMWYKTLFDAPAGNDPVALNLGSMGKGEAWVNGQSIGRYWVSFHTSRGSPSQTWYNIPRAFLKPTGNLLVLLEEEKGYPPGITVDTVSVTKVCGYASKSHLSAVQLSCPPKRNISRIIFASFGTPSGNCESYAIGNCHSSSSKANVEKAFLKFCWLKPNAHDFKFHSILGKEVP
ncbi:hypothetical protein D5086_011097 [Populus alba]|uniref:Uncharacterized protein n=1 Tax=Populus alba TaxID=43335 RepID=A0ACC4CBD6_POPAL